MTEEIKHIDDEAVSVIYTDVTQTNGQIASRAFTYKVTLPNVVDKIYVTVITTSSTVAREGLKQQLPEGFTAQQITVSDHLIQVNDQGVIEV